MHAEAKEAAGTALVFNVSFILAPILGAWVVLWLLGQGVEELSADGSLVLASIAIASSSIPLALPPNYREYEGRVRVLLIGLTVAFCFPQAIVYGAVYFDIGTHGVPADRAIDSLDLSIYSVASIPVAICLSLSLAITRRVQEKRSTMGSL